MSEPLSDEERAELTEQQSVFMLHIQDKFNEANATIDALRSQRNRLHERALAANAQATKYREALERIRNRVDHENCGRCGRCIATAALAHTDSEQP